MRQHAIRRLATIGLVAGALGACSNMLDVSNPGAIAPGNLDDPTMTASLANSVVGEFQRMYTQNGYWGAILGDEAVTGHNYQQYHDFDMRIIDPGNFSLPDVYNPVQRSRALGEDIVSHLKKTLGDTASRNMSVATAEAYTGYANIVLAEAFCSAPVDPAGDSLSSDAIMRRAITYFDDAIATATAAKAAGVSASTADPIINLARVGGARASLWLNDKTKAVSYASAVPTTYVMWINHATSPSSVNNPWYGAVTGTNKNIGVDTAFRGLKDPRVRYQTKGQTGHDQRTVLYVPYLAESFGSWNNTDSTGFAIDSRIRLASGLEAQYILAEMGGMDNTALLAFINARRAVGKQAAFTGTDLQAELRDQRRRDFFLDGHRLADLRRYKRYLGIDGYPTGSYVNAYYGTTYGSATCFIPTTTEWTGYPRK